MLHAGPPHLIPGRFDFGDAIQDHAQEGHTNHSRKRNQSVSRPQRGPRLRGYTAPPLAFGSRITLELGTRYWGLGLWIAADSATTTAIFGTGHRPEILAADKHDDDEQEVEEGEEAEGQGAEHDEKAVQRWRNPERVQHRGGVADLEPHPRRDGRQ